MDDDEREDDDMSIGNRIVSPWPDPEDDGDAGSLRPTSLSTFVGQSRLKERLAEGGDETKPLLELVGGDIEAISGPVVTEAAQDGDPVALELLHEVGRWLGEGIASLTAVLDPAVVVIGGGVSEAGALLLDPIREHFRSNLTGRGFRPELAIRPAELGNRAGMIGAADLARRS